MSITPRQNLGEYTLASVVQLTREGHGHCWTLTVDGQRFPFLIDRIATADLDTDEVPNVTITLLADHVQIDNARTRARHEAAWETKATPADWG